MRAILSVYDKTGLIDSARGLLELGAQIYSTGGTKRALSEAGIPARSVEELTGFPEMLDGRVKTLHPAIYGGILARRDKEDHMDELEKRGMVPIDIVAVNLYPFVETVARPDASLDEALENIDIGGPTMIRAAAKNFPDVLVLVDPEDYQPVLEQLRRGEVGLEERKRLAQKAFQHVALYDTAIANYLRMEEEKFPDEMTIALKKVYNLRYGENPHQEAAFYTEATMVKKEPGMVSAVKLGGMELSFNNILDLDAALDVVSDFSAPTVAIIKHTNPCGLSSHPDLAEAYRRALAGDPVAAFGGIVASSRPIDLATAEEITNTHYDAIIAPGYDEEALKLLKKKRNLRILESPPPEPQSASSLDIRRVRGGLLIQSSDSLAEERLDLRTVTKRKPTDDEMRDLTFAWRAAKHIKSNAIVLARDESLLGMGAGQPSRVVSVAIALEKAGESARGSVMGSDAFFPFPDGVEMAARGGVTAIIQPGGSVRDEEVIRACDESNIAMVFTGIRHFRH